MQLFQQLRTFVLCVHRQYDRPLSSVSIRNKRARAHPLVSVPVGPSVNCCFCPCRSHPTPPLSTSKLSRDSEKKRRKKRAVMMIQRRRQIFQHTGYNRNRILQELFNYRVGTHPFLEKKIYISSCFLFAPPRRHVVRTGMAPF